MIWNCSTAAALEENADAFSTEASTRPKPSFEPFDSEASLVEAMLKSLRGAKRTGWTTVRELDAGVGYADIVLTNRTPRSTRSLKILASIPSRLAPLFDPNTSSGVTSLAQLSGALGLSEKAASRVLASLNSSGVVQAKPMGFSLASVNKPPFQNIVAVEAKLSDWARALVQAYRNQQFADASWVVLDHRYHRAAVKNAERFVRTGVGLASIAQDRSVFVHVPAQATGPVSTGKRWTAQAALAKRLQPTS